MQFDSFHFQWNQRRFWLSVLPQIVSRFHFRIFILAGLWFSWIFKCNYSNSTIETFVYENTRNKRVFFLDHVHLVTLFSRVFVHQRFIIIMYSYFPHGPDTMIIAFSAKTSIRCWVLTNIDFSYVYTRFYLFLYDVIKILVWCGNISCLDRVALQQ